MNNDNFMIERDDIENAQRLCCTICDPKIRSRAAANALMSSLAGKFFSDVEVDTESGLYKIPTVSENIEIADVYIKGNYIDVRLYFDENEIFVPKSHFELDILPVAYMFIKVEEDLSAASVIGFILPENIDTSKEEGGYYRVNEDDFVSFYDIETRLLEKEDEIMSFCETPEDAEKLIYDFVDGKLADSKNLYKLLVASKEAREMLSGVAYLKVTLSSLNFDDSSVEETPTVAEVSLDEPADISMIAGSDSLETFSDADQIDDLMAVDTEDEIIPLDDEPSLLSDGIDIMEDLSADVEPIGEEPSEMQEVDSLQASDDIEQIENAEIFEMSEPNETDIVSDIVPQDEINEPVEVENTDNEVDNIEEFVVEEGERPTDTNIEELVIDEQDDTSPAVEVVEIPDYEPVENAAEEDFDEFSKLSEFDYSTEITPSMNTIESVPEAAEETSDFISEEMLEASPSTYDTSSQEEMQETVSDENEQQIDELFPQNPNTTAGVKKKKSPVIPLLGFFVILAAAGYWGYNKYFVSSELPSTPVENNYNIPQNPLPKTAEKAESAMPVESVEDIAVKKVTNEASNASIPAIEQNLDAAIEVSNLSVNWEVPSSYTTNTTAKRYFVRIGKIMQLNLKTELLLLSAPPITNQVTLELEYNKDLNKFTVKNIIKSSGSANIDKVIKETAEKTLGINLNMNMSVFNNLHGNPVLIIKL